MTTPARGFIVGERVEIVRPVERFPFFIANPGLRGTVTEANKYCVAVRLDEPLVGAEEWDNEVHWLADYDAPPTDDLRSLAHKTWRAPRVNAREEV